MHGDQDPLVPVSQSQELYDALKAAGDKATLHIVLGAAHGGPQFMTPANIALIDGFFNGILNPANKSASAN
jgi:dipeptidyl aminopeptidase/acylaminoacyl peptidase